MHVLEGQHCKDCSCTYTYMHVLNLHSYIESSWHKVLVIFQAGEFLCLVTLIIVTLLNYTDHQVISGKGSLMTALSVIFKICHKPDVCY